MDASISVSVLQIPLYIYLVVTLNLTVPVTLVTSHSATVEPYLLSGDLL